MNINLDISSDFLSDIDKCATQQEYIDKVISLLKPILYKRFNDNKYKQEIIPHKDRINFSCPVCGDSAESAHKKRGNIILKGNHKNHFKCFNCGEFKRVDDFFKQYNVNLSLDVLNYISSNVEEYKTNINSKYDISLILNVNNSEQYGIDREFLKNKFGLVESYKSSVWQYLTNRLQFSKERFLYNPLKNYILILNLLPSGKILGAQKRVFKGLNKYLTFNNSKLHEICETNIKPPEEIDVFSQLFGLYQIQFNKPITVFEGPLDSFLMYNSIANCGASKHFPLDINVRYWYDYDKKGIEKAMEFINDNKSIFLWGKFINDYQLPNRKKWDLNDVCVYLKDKRISNKTFEKYFSISNMDIIDF